MVQDCELAKNLNDATEYLHNACGELRRQDEKNVELKKKKNIKKKILTSNANTGTERKGYILIFWDDFFLIVHDSGLKNANPDKIQVLLSV